MAAAAARWPWALLCLAAAPLLSPTAAGLSCCYHAKDNLMCRDVCEQILSSKSDSRLKHLLQRAPEYCPESMREVWGCINSSLPGLMLHSTQDVGQLESSLVETYLGILVTSKWNMAQQCALVAKANSIPTCET